MVQLTAPLLAKGLTNRAPVTPACSLSGLRLALPLPGLVLLGIVLMCLSGPALSKEFYKWVDDNGVTHYSAHPPKDRAATRVRATNIRDTASEAPQDSSANSEEEGDRVSLEGAVAEPAKDPQRCAQAQNNLKALQENARVRVREGDELRYLTQEEIQEQIETARAIIQQEC